MLPRTTSRRGRGSHSRLWQKARTRVLRWSPDQRTRSMKWLPTLPVAPVTRMYLGTSKLDCSMAWQSTSEHEGDQRCQRFLPFGMMQYEYLFRNVIPQRGSIGARNLLFC